MGSLRSKLRNHKLASVSAVALAAAFSAVIAAQPAHAIIVRDDVGLAASVDTANQYPAVVQLFDWDTGNLYGGGANGIYYNCTGTLVNPRTILTAAHCVTNEGSTSSEDWGMPGQAPLTKMIGFGVDTVKPLLKSINSDVLLGYNEGGVALSTDVIIHPSAELTHGNQAFPWTDTALVAMNEPVANVNPMGMLLSPLSSLTHVVQIGYGSYAVASEGYVENVTPIGTKRLMGENMLGILGSDSDFLDGIFPAGAPFSDSGYETQVEYYTDFDNPNRPSANAGCTFTGNDINCVNAAAEQNIDYFPGGALPREVTTAPGDLGGPLIADRLGKGVPALVIGNLSGGWTLFDTPSDQYGGNGTSFYQPLFAEWQFLIQNDPYKYVGAKVGNGAWEDPTHWVQLQDPNLYIIDSNGNVVTGTPTGAECGVYQTGPKVGTVLGTDINTFNETTSSPYYFPPEGGTCATASGGSSGAPSSVGGSVPVSASTTTAKAGTATENSDVSHAQVMLNGSPLVATAKTKLTTSDSATFMSVVTRLHTPQASAPSYPVYPSGSTDPRDYGGNLPQSSTLLGPGSTNFVPDNTDGTVGTAYTSPAQYFDVRLSQAGTTTLSSYREIDRLTIEGSAGLSLDENGVLLSNIDIEIYDNAHLHVDGIIGTSDIIADGGVISGNGIFVLGASVVPTALSAIVIGNGAITAGGVGSVGTMTVLGNVGVSSGGMMLVDADKNGTDLLNIYGVLAMNGTVTFNSVAGVTPFWHQGGTFAIADTVVTTGMSVPDTLPGVLYPVVSLTHGTNSDSLSVTLEAASFTTVFTPTNPDQSTFAGYFDAARSKSYDALSSLYGTLDTLNGTTLGNAFDQLVPNTQRATEGAGGVIQNTFSSMLLQRLSDLHLAERGDPSQTATGFSVHRPDDIATTLDLGANRGWDYMNSPLGGGSFGAAQPLLSGSSWSGGGAPTSDGVAVDAAQSTSGSLDGLGGFFSASILNGHTNVAGMRDNVDGYAIVTGLDALVDTYTVLGGAFSYSDAKVKLPAAANHSETRAYQGSLYGTWSDPDLNIYFDGFAGYGALSIDLARTAVIGATTYSATAKPSGSQATAGVTGGTVYALDQNISLYPSIGLEYDSFTIDKYSETGGIIAMSVSQDTTEAMLVRIGTEARGNFVAGGGVTIYPRLRAAVVSDLNDSTGTFQSSFIAVPGSSIALNKIKGDTTWFEVGAGFDVNLGGYSMLRLGYDGTLGRSSGSYGALTGKLDFKF